MTTRTKPTDTFPRVLRGGAWYFTSASLVRAAFRDGSTPSVRGSGVGFRCALRGREPRDPSKVGL